MNAGQDGTGGTLGQTANALSVTVPQSASTRGDVLADTVAGDPGAAPSGPGSALARGAAVGRYVILSQLGAGGMGVVHAAYDPELDRKVALKLVLPDSGGTHRGSEGHTRLLREAQALARLSHPHVVAVHDVGTLGERVWIAMEFVEGRTLGAWADEAARPWRDVVEMMTRAGEGLAAAHRAGLLHRDFKPDNVMVGVDGRPRVMDFGLARAGSEEEPEVTADILDSGFSALDIELTRAGAMMGTPGYMAPEQFDGGAVTEAADQFAFCVTLWELLYGESPFAGATIVERALAVSRGELRTPPRGRAPAWLRRLCTRGLATDPGQRYPGLDALLVELRSGQRRVRRGRALLVVGSLAAAGGGFAAYRSHDADQRVARCEAAGAAFAEVWSPTVRDEVQTALLGTGASYAAAAATNTLPWLDRYADLWSAARVEACMNGTVRRTWSAVTTALAERCLDARRTEFTSLVEELRRSPDEAALQAVTAAAALSRVEPCADERLLGQLGAPAGDASGAARVSEQLSRARALTLAGRHARALEEAEAARELARALDWPPQVAAASHLVGDLYRQRGDYDLATEALKDAYFVATRAGASEVAALAASALVGVVGNRKAQPEVGLLWGELADTAFAGFEREGGAYGRALLDHNLATVHRAQGAYEVARTHAERSVQARERLLGARHPEVAESIDGLAIVHAAVGEGGEAAALFERARSIREEVLGPEHPDVAISLNNLGNVRADLGALDEAKALYSRAVAISEAAFDGSHPTVAKALHNLALAHSSTGDHRASIELLERVLTIEEETLGDEHPDLAVTLSNLGGDYLVTGALVKARASLERALRIRERELGPTHPEVATTLNNLASVSVNEEKFDQALALLDRALKIREREFGPRSPRLVPSLTLMIGASVNAKRFDEAIAFGERALQICEATEVPLEMDAGARVGLAQALRTAGGDEARVQALGREAQDAFRRAGMNSVADDIGAWLAGDEGWASSP